MLQRLPNSSALKGHSIANVKSHNLRAVLLSLLHNDDLSRVDLARTTGLSGTTMTNLVTELLELGIVAEGGLAPGRRAGAGRPPTLVRLVPSARCAVGVHIGVDNLRVGVTDLFGRLLHSDMAEHVPGTEPEVVLGTAVQMIEAELAIAGVDRERLVGIGVGASGLVDPAHGVNILAPRLGWRMVPIADLLQGHFPQPVFVDNNVRAMAVAEAMFGAAQGVNNMAFIYGRLGVGAGFVVGGQVFRGTLAGAGEIGHTTMIPSGGAPCHCGNTGCLETLVSEQELVRQAQVLAARAPGSLLAEHLSSPDGPLIERVFAAARAGDRDTLQMLNDRARYMGTALANLVNLINPEMIILGGLFAAGHDLLLPQIEETMRQRSFAGLGDRVAVRITSFGREVGVIGAASLALDTFFYR